MATAPDLIPDPNEPDPNAPDPNEPDGEEQPDPYADLAQKMGWTPKDQFKGNPDDWKTAEQFILDGRDIQRTTAQELKGLREQLDVIGRTSASIVEQQVKSRTQEAIDRFNQAIEDGDHKAALTASEEIHTLQGKVNGVDQPHSPPPESLAWAQKNSSWFQKDPLATARAIEICDTLTKTGVRDHATQLKAAEEQVRREFPHLFPQAKPQAGVHAPGSRAPAPSNREKGFSDMPKAAQDIANDMAERGVIKTADGKPESARALYAKNYWANAERKA